MSDSRYGLVKGSPAFLVWGWIRCQWACQGGANRREDAEALRHSRPCPFGRVLRRGVDPGPPPLDLLRPGEPDREGRRFDAEDAGEDLADSGVATQFL